MSLAVIHIIDAAPLGGVEKTLENLLLKQKQEGLHVECIVLIEHNETELIEAYRQTDAKIYHISRPRDIIFGRPFVRLYILFHLLLLLSTRRKHILHLHLSLAAQMGRLAALILGCPYVVETIHGQGDFHHSFKWQKIVFPLIRRKTSEFIVVSKALAAYLKKITGIDAIVVPNGTPLTQALSRQNARQVMALREDSFVVGFVGRLSEEKNIPALLKAMTLVPDAVLILIGDGPCREELKEQADALAVDSRVIFAGLQPEARKLITGLDVFCLPSLHESQGLALLEAMSQKVAIIGSTAPGIRETLGNGEAGLLHEPEDYQALAGHIISLQNSSLLRQKMAERGYTRFMNNYTMEHMHQRLLGVYNKVLESEM